MKTNKQKVSMNMQKQFLSVVAIIFLVLGLGWEGPVQPVSAQGVVLSDSLLKVFSVEELVVIRKILAKQRERLLKQQAKTQSEGLEISQEFIQVSPEENSNQDKILIRIAEYYYEEAQRDFDRAMEEYDRQYKEFERLDSLYRIGKVKVEPKEPEAPKYDYSKAIAIYDLIINNFPDSDLLDDALYNKGYLYKKMDQWDKAEAVFRQLLDQFPESRYAPEAYMELAEYYFTPRTGDSREVTIMKLNKAARLYKNVLQYKDSPRYDEAMYKLGWTYFRLAGADPNYYTDAIVYFVGVVNDIEKLADDDVAHTYVRPEIKPEALEYIAASFVDPAYKNSGVDNAAAFIQKLGMPAYGVDILEKMGDRYAKITQWEDAIQSYQKLLELYPDYAYAPRVQKKIADAYLADQKFEQAFAERQKLFEMYNPHSEWYTQLEQSDNPDKIAALDEAYRLTEEALRANIGYTLARAQEAEKNGEDATAYYEEFAKQARFYLENYPTDENAYEINWSLAFILDTKLHRFREAFDEYIKVSNDYLEDKHRRDAAENAIVVADTLVKMAMAQQDTTQLQGIDFSKMPVQELTPEEKLLAEAYDNFIKLFPNAPETASVLADAGALYYNHKQFDIAKKYYKTMVRKFPKAQQKSIGLISLMNSYFFLGQYTDAEKVARRVAQSPEVPEEQRKLAERRIGESIFKNAEKLEQQGNHLEAAREYFRVYTDAKDYVTFADLALFKSAYNYEQAGEWLKAIDAYNVLVDNFPKSKYVLSALSNIAEDYKELEDYKNVAKTFERIAQMFPGTKDAEVALYNASLFYAKAEDWENAIRVNNEYIAQYPGNPESKDLLFENAKYYLKLNNLTGANEIFQRFANQYPDDPRTIEALYRRGEYYFDQGQFDLAKREFQNAIRRSEEFARLGKNPNLYYAAESYFKLAEILYAEYKAIQFSYPPSNVRAQLKRKQALLKELQKAYAKVIELGSVRGFEAMYRIAEAYEELANAIVNQKIPENLPREKALVERNKAFQAAVPAYDRAVDEYKNVVLNIPKLAEKFGVSLADTARMNEVKPMAADTTADTTGATIAKVVEKDSTLEVAARWYERSREKISKILYDVAQRSYAFVEAYLRTPNPNTGLQALVYEDLLLRKLITPAVATTIKMHLKNLQVSQELGLENKYVVESRRKILLTNNILAEHYAKIFYDAADIYTKNIPVLEDLIQRGENAMTPDGMDFYALQDEVLMQTIFFMDQFSQKTMKSFEQTLMLAENNNIQNDALLTTQEKMFNFAYEASDLMEGLSKQATQKSEFYHQKFDTSEFEPYEVGSAFFEDQAAELDDYSITLMESAYDLSKQYAVDNIWTKLIFAKLVQKNPEDYLTELPPTIVTIQSDSTWKATTQYEPGYNFPEHDDAAWGEAKIVTVPIDSVFQVFDSLQISPPAIWVGQIAANTGSMPVGTPSLEIQDKPIDSVEVDTTVQVDTTGLAIGEESEPDTVTAYFRKKFVLDSRPIGGWLAVTADKIFYLYLNGEYVLGSEDGHYTNVDYLDYEVLRTIIKSGENTVAVAVTDTDGPPRYGLRFYLFLKLMPSEITKVIENLKTIKTEDLSDFTVRKIVILNRNKIVE